MAFYKSSFTNKYLQDVQATFVQKENLTSKAFTTLHYKNGLLIDASGQVYSRNSQTFNFDCGDVTTTYDRSMSMAALNVGMSALNAQYNWVTYTHSFTYKTEMAGIYGLAGAIFLNPSPLKVLHSNPGFAWFKFGVTTCNVIHKEKTKEFLEDERKNDINFYALTLKW